MNSHYFVLLFILIENSFGFKPDHKIDQQARSIYSNKKCKQLFTPARYKVEIKNIMFDQPVSENKLEQYFPDVEYPTNIMEASRPFFYKTGESHAMLGSFPDDVKSSYKTLMEKNKNSFEEFKVKYKNEVRNCFQENKNSAPNEEIITEVVNVLKENDDDVFVDETSELIVDEVSQNMMASIVEDIAEEEMESNDTTSESEETIDENEEIPEIIEQEPPEMIEDNEEETVGGNYYQSWESEQYNSEENITQISEGKDLDPEIDINPR